MPATAAALVTPLTAGANPFAGYYPTPISMGVQCNEVCDPYWGAIDAMLLDEEVDTDIELRHCASIILPWYMEGLPDDVAFAEQILSGLDIERLLEDALRVAEYGFNPLEVTWDDSQGPLRPVLIEKRHPKSFRLDPQGQVYYSPRGGHGFTPVATGKVIPVRRLATRERPYGVSILESIWPIWQIKWTHIAQLERLGQKYSVPSVIALADAQNKDDLGEISMALAGIESGEGVALSGVKEIVQLDARGKAPELLEVIRHYDTKICKRITGQTLTSNSEKNGSRSLGEVHERAAMRIAVGDLKNVFANLNATLLQWIFSFNDKPGQVRFVFDEKAFLAHLRAQQNKGDGITLSNNLKGLQLCL
ncbi:hypothetical protein D3C84_143220 [compost metagenome]